MLPSDSPLAFRSDLYVRTYRNHPGRLARALRHALEEAQRCRQASPPDHIGSEQWEAKAEALESARRTLGRCRICGRELDNPTSVERGVGTSCWRKGKR